MINRIEVFYISLISLFHSLSYLSWINIRIIFQISLR